MGSDDDAPGDLYASERRDANRLSRRWQRGMHRAAAAFAAGDPGAAHRLAAEARRVRCVAKVMVRARFRVRVQQNSC